jgi:2-polyprenyl-6-methoxyphenol hydroxylase-like FAD-dependent oxidoreductase
MRDAVLVVGGGIGGLVVARALARAGRPVTLIESAERLRGEGAGITLGPNAMRALSALGLGDAVAARGRALEGGTITDARNRPLSRADFGPLTARYGPTYALERGALHEALSEGFERGARCGRCPAGAST